MSADQKDLSIALFNAGVFRSGKFYTKSGCVLNAYFDLLAVLGLPRLMDKIAEYTIKFCKTKDIDFQNVCGVTYGGLPFGILVASKLQKPLIMRIKEISTCSDQCRIEGSTCGNGYCFVIEEVMASGRSTLELVKDIEGSGTKVKDVFTIIDLEQGASEIFQKLGYRLHSLLTMSQLTRILCDENLMSKDLRDNICKGFSDMFAPNGDRVTNSYLGIKKNMKYELQINHCKSKMAQKLFRLMSNKKSNLCIDFVNDNFDEVLQVAELIGPYISILIVHFETFNNFIAGSELEKLKIISARHDFLLMDNRKLTEDDEDVVALQCRKIFKHADLLSIQAISGENILHSVKSVINEFPEKGIFVDAYPNVMDTPLKSNYEKSAINFTLSICENVVGFMCQHSNSRIPLGYVHMMSDLKNTASVVGRKNTPFYSSEVIISDICADVILLQYEDVESVVNFVKKEQTKLWDTYANRISSR